MEKGRFFGSLSFKDGRLRILTLVTLSDGPHEALLWRQKQNTLL